MGLEVTATHVIWAFAAVLVVGGATTAFFEGAEGLSEASAARDELLRERLATRVEGATFCHNAAASRVNVTVHNVGDVRLVPSEATLVVDGVARNATASIPGEPGTDLWSPRERAHFTVHDMAAEPERVMFVTGQGVVIHAARVSCPYLATIVLSPASASMTAGDSLDFLAEGYDQHGDPFNGVTYSWTTEAGTIESLNDTAARLSATVAGPDLGVVATADGVSARASVLVHPAAPATVAVSPDPTHATAGGTRQFTATAHDRYGNVNATAPIAWTTDAGSISPSGLLAAQTTAETGKSVTATSGSASGTAVVDILPDAPATLVVAPDPASVVAGESQAFSATAHDQYGNVNASAPITWTTDAGTIAQDGTLTAQTTAATGRSVTATSGSASGSATVDIVAGPPAVVVVSPASATVEAGSSRAFTAVAYDQHGNPNTAATLAWSAARGSVAADGTYTAPTTSGSDVVTVTTNGVSDTASVVVSPGAPSTMSVSPGVAGVPTGGTRTFTATPRDSYGNVNSTAPVSWQTTAGSISPDGTLTAPTTPSNGNTVTATSGSAVGTAGFDVHPGAPTSISMSPSNAGVPAGSTFSFTATPRDAYGNVNTTAPLGWATSAGTVSQSGVLTAQTTAAAGRNVTATSGDVRGVATVDVLANAPATMTLMPASASVTAGGTQAFTATVRDAYGNVNGTASVSWGTTAGSISPTGVLTAQTATATGRSVTATSGAASGTATVNVVAGPVATVSVAPSSATVNTAATTQFAATGYDQYGNVVANATFTWSAARGSVSTGGLHTAPTTVGSDTVTATSNGKSGSASVSVIRTIRITAIQTYSAGVATSTFAKGTTVETRVSLVDHRGVTVEGASVAIRITDPNGATRLANGTATTNAQGVSSYNYTLPNSNLAGTWTITVLDVWGPSLVRDPAADVATSQTFQEA